MEKRAKVTDKESMLNAGEKVFQKRLKEAKQIDEKKVYRTCKRCSMNEREEGKRNS